MSVTCDGPLLPAALAAAAPAWDGPLPQAEQQAATAAKAAEAAAAAAALTPALAALRNWPWWRLRFPAAMEQVYDRVATHARARRVNVCNLVGSGCFWPMTAADASNAPHVAGTIDALRCAVTVWLYAGTFWIIWRGKRDHAWEVDLPTSISLTVITAYGIFITRVGGGVMGAITAAGLFSTIMFSAIVVRQSFRHALAVTVITLVSYAVAIADRTGAVRVIADGTVRLLFTAGLFSLFANYTLDRRERRAYVLRLCEAERQAALTSGVQTLRRLSHCDPLTGLANRRHFDGLVEQAWIGAGNDGRVALLLLDIDHFKRYNDRYGHPAGDACLQAVATAIDAAARAHGGMAARIGGEEFAVLLPGQAWRSALPAAEAVCAAVRALALPHADADAAPFVTLSIGIATARPHDGHGLARIFDVADQALYRAKDAGRNRWASADDMAAPCPPAPATEAIAEAESETETEAGTEAEAKTAMRTAPTPSLASVPVPVPSSSAEAVAAVAPQGLRRAPQDHVAWLQGLQAVLLRPWFKLRFAPELEADYDRAWSHRRGVRLFVLGILGIVYSAVYQRLGGAMFPPLADVISDLVEQLGVTVELPLMLMLLLPMRTWLRESVFGVTVLVMGLCFPLVASSHPTLPMQAYGLALFLVPMYSAVIAEQPFKYSLVLSLLLFVSVTALMRPADADADGLTAWMICAGLKILATAYALVAGFLLECSTRRNHVLTRLDEVQGGLLQDQRDRLAVLATVDPVTGIANRRLYDDAQARLWKECGDARQPLALLLIDVDDFKRYNDLYGHPAGDACLRTVAQSLLRWSADRTRQGHPGSPGRPERPGRPVRPERFAPLPARLGGEEFGVLLPGCTQAEALQAGASLCDAVAALGLVHAASPTAAHLSVSIGVAAMQPASCEPDLPTTALLAAADAALYRAKAAGRNRACV